MRNLILILFLFCSSLSNAQFSMFYSQNTNTASGWNILNATYSQSFNLSTQSSYQRSMYILNDTCMFVVETTNNRVYHYSISSGALTYRKYYSIGSYVYGSIDLKSNGLIMYLNSSSDILQYSLSTAWDITTATYIRNKSFNTYSSNIRGVKFSSDGLSVYVGSSDYDDIKRYSLSTAWDISTATTSSYLDRLLFGSYVDYIYDFDFSSDGKFVYILDAYGKVVIYSLSTAWDITTATYLGQKDIYSVTGYAYGLGFTNIGDRMFISGNNSGYIYQYNIQ